MPVVIRDPTPEDVARFLATRTSQQMLEVVRSLQEPAAQAAFTNEILRNPLPTPNPRRISMPQKSKKALNAFVGFRCYYLGIPLFKTWPMKKISFFMGALWDNDPNKHLWTLMAKSWSMVRDQVGKDNASLYDFFQIICPYLEIPAPETYLQMYGWTVSIDATGEPTFSREESIQPAPVVAEGDSELLSAESIVDYCQQWGYAPLYQPDLEAVAQSISARTEARKKRRAKQINYKAAKINRAMIRKDIAIVAQLPAQLGCQTEADIESLRPLNTRSGSPHFAEIARQLRDQLAARQNDPITITHEMLLEADAEDEEIASWTNYDAFADDAGADADGEDDVTLPSTPEGLF